MQKKHLNVTRLCSVNANTLVAKALATHLQRAILLILVTCQVITEAAEAGEPLLFFCRVGKDRTGVLAALILACCGAKPEEIIADYHRYEAGSLHALFPKED